MNTALSVAHANLHVVTQLNDFELLELWVENNDRRAGDKLVKRYYVQVARYFMNTVGDNERKDLTQETFTRLTKVAARFEHRSSFRSFLFAIARNVLNEFLRTRYRKGEFDPELHTIEDVDQRTPSRVISDLVRKDVLIQCLRALPVEKKQLLELYYWHGLNAKELGAMLDIPEATVRSRVHGVTNKLRDLVGKREPNLGGLDLEKQLGSLRRLLGFGPCEV